MAPQRTSRVDPKERTEDRGKSPLAVITAGEILKRCRSMTSLGESSNKGKARKMVEASLGLGSSELLARSLDDLAINDDVPRRPSNFKSRRKGKLRKVDINSLLENLKNLKTE
ncbi:unnamed protein product [Calypogeia fissa]